MFGISEIAIILMIAIVVLSAKKLPELARSMGKSARILKSEARVMKADGPASAPGPHQQAAADTPRIVEGTVVDAPSPRPVPQPGTEGPQR
ncbi:twin-arginine translocase TatA/TatE family subunit [Streptomyces virginiae]|uniref:twin-arginine translocase TatA/TatE family subunit n=1 Tax=Streptomyces virginiae TaxID=1961 RepID=UPI00345554CA